MAVLGITLRTVQSLEPGETIWDAGHGKRCGALAFGANAVPPSMSSGTVHPGASVSLQSARTDRLGRLMKARKEAKRLLGLVADGKDPADERALAALQAADTLSQIADQYLKHAKQKQRPRTHSEIERYLLVTWKPLHPVPVVHIRRRHVAARIAEIATDHGAVTAARARAALSAMFNWAIREGLDIAANPVLGTNRPAEPRSRERVLTDGEIAEIWAALGDGDYGRIVKLLLLTAQRRDEVGGMRWMELGSDKAVWIIPSTRTKNRREHTVPLAEAAVALLPPQLCSTHSDP